MVSTCANCGKTYKHPPSKNSLYCSRECYTAVRNSPEIYRRNKDRLYRVWIGMKERCYRKGHISSHWYSEKGISVCDEWIHDFPAFKKWSLENGYDYSKSRKEQALDRIDNSKGYSPENCHWVTVMENMHNTSRNVFLTHNGETKCISEWSRDLGISIECIRRRLTQTTDLSKVLSPKPWRECNGIRKTKTGYELVLKKKYIGSFRTYDEALKRRKEIVNE